MVTKLFTHCFAGPRSEDQALEQGIARQAVCSVNTRTCGFTGGVESGQACLTVQSRAHPAHKIMSGRPNGHKVNCDIDVVLQTGRINAREARLDVVFLEM